MLLLSFCVLWFSFATIKFRNAVAAANGLSAVEVLLVVCCCGVGVGAAHFFGENVEKGCRRFCEGAGLAVGRE